MAELEEEDEERIDELLSEVLLVDASERTTTLARVCEAHPELAAALRGRWSALEALGLDRVLAPSPADSGHPERLGDFVVREVLGGGGMGIVYLADQVSLNRPVALKVMRPEGAFFADSRERFRREVEAIARLEHAGIVKVHAVGEQDGVPYFAMERIDGLTLAEVLRGLCDRAPSSLSGKDLRAAIDGEAAALFELSWVDACAEIGRRTAAALQHAHEHGIVHRDVKPSNVAVTRDGRVQLFDFGLAASSGVDRLTRSGGHLGTLHYMPPEQLRGERELDARSDVYALGVTLYELLALEAPFEGESRISIETRILEGQPPALRAVNRRVSPELERVVRKAMDLETGRRYATARDLAEDLQRVLDRQPVLAKPPTPVLRARRWAQRSPARAVALLAAVGLFGVTPTVLLWRERSHSAELAAALDAERAALRDAQSSFRFVEHLLFASDPYRNASPDKRVADLLRDGVDSLEQIEGLQESPRLEGRLKLGLASALWSYSMFAEALPLAERALEIEDALGEPLLAIDNRPLDAVINSLSGLGRFDEVIARIEERLVEGDPHSEVFEAKLHYLVGTAQMNIGRYEASEKNLRTALGYYSGDEAQAESREPLMAIRWRLAGSLVGMQRFQDALAELEPALELARELYPEDHPSVAEGLTNMAFAVAGLGDLEVALDMQVEALEIIERYYGETSFAAFRFQSDLTILLGQAKRWEEGVRAAARTEAIGAALFGPDDPRTAEARRVRGVYQTWVDGIR